MNVAIGLFFVWGIGFALVCKVPSPILRLTGTVTLAFEVRLGIRLSGYLSIYLAIKNFTLVV